MNEFENEESDIAIINMYKVYYFLLLALLHLAEPR